MLVAFKKPTWNDKDDKLAVAAGPDGLGRYKAEPLMGDFVVLLAPTVSLRYDF